MKLTNLTLRYAFDMFSIFVFRIINIIVIAILLFKVSPWYQLTFVDIDLSIWAKLSAIDTLVSIERLIFKTTPFAYGLWGLWRESGHH